MSVFVQHAHVHKYAYGRLAMLTWHTGNIVRNPIWREVGGWGPVPNSATPFAPQPEIQGNGLGVGSSALGPNPGWELRTMLFTALKRKVLFTCASMWYVLPTHQNARTPEVLQNSAAGRTQSAFCRTEASRNVKPDKAHSLPGQLHSWEARPTLVTQKIMTY